MAEENKNLTENVVSSFSSQSKVYHSSNFSYRNKNFLNIEEFHNRINLFKTNKEKFWGEEIEKLIWFKKPDKIRNGLGIKSKWFGGSKSNITVNCIDKHLNSENKNKAAIIWESEHGKNWILTYQLLYSYMNRTANTIKKLGLKKGNKVCIICGSLPETIFSVLACARLGITFTVLNPTISIHALSNKIRVGNFDLIILADSIYKKGQTIEIKNKVDSALEILSINIKKLIFRRIKNLELTVNTEYDFLMSDFLDSVSDTCPPTPLNNNAPLFSTFDFDSEGNLIKRNFSAAGFMVQTYSSSLYAFDFTSDDIFWCNSDFSSIAGLAYGIFAPLMHGISTFVYEGLPNYPTSERIWKLINNYKITKLLTESYIIKALINLDDLKISDNELLSLRLISVTGNFLADYEWEKIYDVVCNKKILLTNCFISEVFGNIVFSDIPGISNITTGFVNTDFPAVDFDVVDSNYKSANNEPGLLIFKDSLLCPISHIVNNIPEEKFFRLQKKKNFISSNYLSKKSDKTIKIIYRVDDKLEIAGELVSKSQIKSVIESHAKVKSCIIETRPDSIFYLLPVALVELHNPDDAKLLLKEELRNMVEKNISVAAKPVEVIFTHSENNY